VTNSSPAHRHTDEADLARPVPVLLITGAVGVGKTTVTDEASWLLGQAGIPHAMADLAVIGGCWPTPSDDKWNEELIHRNLACMWVNFQRAGAGRLLLCRVLEARSLLTRTTEAVPGAVITVVRLRAPLEAVRTGSGPERPDATRSGTWMPPST
jgi:hypothetical protein